MKLRLRGLIRAIALFALGLPSVESNNHDELLFEVGDANIIQKHLYEDYDSLDDTHIREAARIKELFKRDNLVVTEFTSLDDWEVQNIELVPGEVRAYNFTTKFDTNQPSAVVYISANICKYPDSIGNDSSLDCLVFYQSYDGGNSYFPLSFEEGYYQSVDWEYVTSSSNEMTILLYVEFRDSSSLESTDIFHLQFAVSADDLVFQWDNGTFVSFVDADDDSALFQSTAFNLTTNSMKDVINGTSGYSIHIFKDEEASYFTGLSKSWCAVNGAPGLVSASDVEGFYSDSVYDFRKNFVVNGLNASSDYLAYITRNVDGDSQGGAVYTRIPFSTADEGVCELIHGMSFCDSIAYAVPQSTAYTQDHNTTALMNLYDSFAKQNYENFDKALQQINCYGEEDAIFSPIATCEDCANSYKNWLCAVTFPRCSTIKKDEYKLRELNNSRNSYINEVVNPPNPYYEVLPCINLCYAIVRDCPSDFQFECPSTNETLLESYNYLTDLNYTTCNLVGNTTVLTSGASLTTSFDIKLLTTFLTLWVLGVLI